MSKSTVRTPTVEFARASSPATEAGDVVRRRGVIFRAGTYPEKSYAMTPDELRRQVAEFSPVPIDLGHPSSPSPLDGKFGELEAVELSDDGTTLFGTVAFPRWLDEMMGDARRRVSASWDRAAKRLKSLSLVTHPHIPEAELQAAFACACGHDEAKAETPTETEDPPMTKKEQALAKLEAMSEDDRDAWYAAIQADGGSTQAVGDDTDDEVEETSAGTDPAAFAEVVAVRSELEQLKAERRQERAVTFAAQMKQQGRIAPFEEDATAAVMFAAMSDDNAIGDTVNFAVGDKAATGSREQMVRAAYGQRIPHGKTEEAIGDRAQFGRRALDNGGGAETPEQKQARVDKRLANTPFGEAILARRKGNARV